MHTQKRYKKAPVTEAIIDIKAKLPNDFNVNEIKEIHPLVKETLPKVEPFYKGVGAINYQLGATFEINTSEQQVGFWFRKEDNLQTFQASSEGFTFNQLAPYESWEKFSNDARTYWEIYRKICQPISVTRVALRYVNQLNIPISPHLELKDYLKTAPEVSSDLTQGTLQSFFMQLHIPQPDLNCILVINEAIIPPREPETLAVLLDLDLSRQQTWASDDKNIWEFLMQLRDRKNEVFEASITDKMREVIS